MQLESILPVFVYGSLRAGEFNYKRYLDGNVLSSTPNRARIKGSLYDMPYKGYPALLVEKFNTEWVYGEVFELLDFESTLSNLDVLEGYIGVDHPDNEYERREVMVEVWQEQSKTFVAKKALVYLYRMENDSLFYKQTELMKDGIWRPREFRESLS
ncbi:butirosin biosynthesis protein BtrG [Carnobacterium sp. 17-4]|uniref:gamma-glutamylcyclotransferase family protein n=1 Tax=Carnobacterium sp. (strain 17-4) TaxID=208596 RepID=UPI0002058C12|nr:gamma-glutamylcyclotransferase family protein [Carnobacterium sp. 17-4]AEB30144.1 butirosin biosynthesis protein BtrG [Carnobacterium sp. 17-4]